MYRMFLRRAVILITLGGANGALQRQRRRQANQLLLSLSSVSKDLLYVAQSFLDAIARNGG